MVSYIHMHSTSASLEWGKGIFRGGSALSFFPSGRPGRTGGKMCEIYMELMGGGARSYKSHHSLSKAYYHVHMTLWDAVIIGTYFHTSEGLWRAGVGSISQGDWREIDWARAFCFGNSTSNAGGDGHMLKNVT